MKTEFHSSDGVFVKTMHLPEKGMLVPQHAHEYSHLSMLATGSVRAWRNEEWLGDFKAPYGIEIKEKCKHRFLSLEPNTTIYCIHNVSRTGEVEIHELHEIGG